MAERCIHAYRKRGKNAVFCKAIEGENNYCAFQQMCHNTKRFEATSMAGQCKLRSQKAVK